MRLGRCISSHCSLVASVIASLVALLLVASQVGAATEVTIARAQIDALAFRALGVERPDLIMSELPFAASDRVPKPVAELTWSTFFAGSLVHIGYARSSRPVYAYFNPYMDVAVLLSWNSLEQQGSPITQVCVAPGEFIGALHLRSLGRVPRWRSSDDPVGSLRATLRKRISGLERAMAPGTGRDGRIPERLCSATARDAAEVRMYDVVLGLTSLAQATSALESFVIVARSGTQQAISAEASELPKQEAELAAMIGPALAEFGLSAVIETGKGERTVLLSHAPSARDLVAIKLIRGEDRWRVTRFSAFRITSPERN
jgi:hypothetical protein